MNLEIANKTNTDLQLRFNKLNESDKKQQGSSF
jgi:hypothetical protein